MLILGRLRRRRLEQALTQHQLGERAHLSKQAISRLERGVVEPRPSTLARLALALDCTPLDLLDPDTTAR